MTRFAQNLATVMEGFDEDDEDDLFFQAADDDVLPAPKFNEKIEAISETIRSGAAANIHDERPDWMPSWVKLIAIIRGAIYPVVWEKSAGTVGLTREFLR